MSFKPKFQKTSWRAMLFSLATLATLALAAGARFKPN
jgi:anti-sigma-K factor RskA